MSSCNVGASFQIVLVIIAGLISYYVKNIWTLLTIVIVFGIVKFCTSSNQGISYLGYLRTSTNVFLSKLLKNNLNEDVDQVLVMGPYGKPSGGTPFDYNGYGIPIKKMIFRSGALVESIAVLFENDDGSIFEKAGEGGPNHNEFTLEDGEYITEVRGTFGRWTDKDGILNITFFTNMKRKFGRYGADPERTRIEEAGSFQRKGGKLIGIKGTIKDKHNIISSIGFYFQQIRRN